MEVDNESGPATAEREKPASLPLVPSPLIIIVEVSNLKWRKYQVFPANYWVTFNLSLKFESLKKSMNQNSPLQFFFLLAFLASLALHSSDPQPWCTIWTNGQHVTDYPFTNPFCVLAFSWMDHHSSLITRTSGASNQRGRIPSGMGIQRFLCVAWGGPYDRWWVSRIPLLRSPSMCVVVQCRHLNDIFDVRYALQTRLVCFLTHGGWFARMYFQSAVLQDIHI